MIKLNGLNTGQGSGTSGLFGNYFLGNGVGEGMRGSLFNIFKSQYNYIGDGIGSGYDFRRLYNDSDGYFMNSKEFKLDEF